MTKIKNQEPVVNKNVFSELEEEVQAFWEKSKTFEKSVKKEAPLGDYVFYDGPPFATGLPHYGHIVASIIKDVVPRFWTMNGYRVERKWGWDCHGLPIENIVEKEMGSQRKKDIEALGVDKFNELCRARVSGYVDDWKKVIGKLGRWADMENDYKTMDLPFMESVWYVFKTMYDKGLIYKSYRSMHICPRCETTLSQSEVTEGYKDIKDISAIVKFELVDEPGTYVLAWTTTPWTLIGNVALAVGAETKYIKTEIAGHEGKYIFAQDLYEKITGRPQSEAADIKEPNLLSGRELVGKSYLPLFDYYAKNEKLENRENGWKIYAGDFVSTEEGTGVVHIAPAFGDDDMRLGKENNLPFVQHVAMDGFFAQEVKDFPGLNVKPIGDHMSTDIEIIKYLAHNTLLFHKEKYEHSYPHCWRCDTPLLNYATSSWFVNVTKIKPELLENAKDINWSPTNIKHGRWGQWLEGARDWSISRQRFWASVMPIWECDRECGERKVVGSVAELEALSGTRVDDLHKHIVDQVVFDCPCGGLMKRIPDVLDTWFDSGSMPFAQMHYPFENKEKFEKNFPAQFIAEGTDQTRCWFYYMHVLAGGTKSTNAFKNVIVNGIVLAEDGKKMSKKLKNYPDPMLVFEKYGADPLRYYLLTSPVMLAETLNFSEKAVGDALRRVNMILWNVVKFYQMFAQGEKSEYKRPVSENILDNWILARLDQLVSEVTAGMKAYNLPEASRPIAPFVDDLSTWYIRNSRERFKDGQESDKQSAIETTGYVLVELSKVMAPFTPFIAEQVWQAVTGYTLRDEDQSVHLEAWPQVVETIDQKTIEDMEKVRKIVEIALAKRDEHGIKVRQPLASLSVKNCHAQISEQYKEMILKEVNIKNFGTIELGEGELSVELDTKLTPELLAEGIKRELVRTINAMRKNAGLTINDTINISYEASGAVAEVMENYSAELTRDTLASSIVKEKNEGKEVTIGEDKIVLSINKV
jgi:isoleucyl-tRNA synthetase